MAVTHSLYNVEISLLLVSFTFFSLVLLIHELFVPNLDLRPEGSLLVFYGRAL